MFFQHSCSSEAILCLCEKLLIKCNMYSPLKLFTWRYLWHLRWLWASERFWNTTKHSSWTDNHPIRNVASDSSFFRYFWKASIQCWLDKMSSSVFRTPCCFYSRNFLGLPNNIINHQDTLFIASYPQMTHLAIFTVKEIIQNLTIGLKQIH